jgi:Mor family transcriptional regulator
MRGESLFATFVRDAAVALTSRLAARLPELQRQAFRDAAEHILFERAASVLGGERVYAPQCSPAAAEQARQRTIQAIKDGAKIHDVARSERVSVRTVYRRLRGQIRP